MATVIKRFRDKDTNKLYMKGDQYTHEDAERVAFLVEKGFVEGTEAPKDKSDFPKHTGGGWYELADGSKVKGKEEAVSAMKDLEKRGE